jgi:hypothetical protein
MYRLSKVLRGLFGRSEFNGERRHGRVGFRPSAEMLEEKNLPSPLPFGVAAATAEHHVNGRLLLGPAEVHQATKVNPRDPGGIELN